MLAITGQADVVGITTVVGLLLLWFVGPPLACVVAWVSVTRNRPLRGWKLASILVGLAGWITPTVWFAILVGPHLWAGDWMFVAIFALVASAPSLAIDIPLARDLWRDRPGC